MNSERFELVKLRLLKKQYQIDKSKLILSVISVLIAAFVFYKYFDEKNIQRRMDYKNSISNLYSSNPHNIKLAIRELSKYEKHIPESIRNIADVLFTCNDSTFNTLKNDLGLIIRLYNLGFANEVIRYGQEQQSFKELSMNDRFKDIIEVILRKSYLLNKQLKVYDLDLHNIDLSRAKIENITFSNIDFDTINFAAIIVNNCTFSDVFFNHGSLWKSTFEENVIFNEVTFTDINLSDAVLNSDCKNCSFENSNVLNMQIKINPDNIGNIFQNCIQTKTIKIIN